MKNNFYSVSLTVVFSLLLLFMYYRVSNLEHKYETLKEANVRLKSNLPLTDAQIKERQFKEEMYIRQQESDTNLILIVFTTALGLTAFLTFTSVKRDFERRSSIIEDKYTENTRNIDSKHSLILELKARMDLDSSQSNFSQSSYFFHEEDYEYYITSFLDGVKFKVYHSLWMSDKFLDTKDILLKEVVSQLKRFLKILDTIEIPETLSNFQLTELKKEIRKINNDEVDNLLSIIYSKLTPIKNA